MFFQLLSCAVTLNVIEFGKLAERLRRNGNPGAPRDEVTLMIQWSWRIERKDSIMCGIWSDERNGIVNDRHP